MLQIQFNEIPEEGLQIIVDDATWFPERDFDRHGELKAFLYLKRSSDRVLVNGSIEVALLFHCDRCLEEFISPQKIEFQLVMEVAEIDRGLSNHQDAEYEYDPGQIEVVFFDGQLVDIGELLCQQMILAVPQKRLCNDDCCGICGHCGADLNSDQCSCASESETSSFAFLNQLLKNNK